MLEQGKGQHPNREQVGTGVDEKTQTTVGGCANKGSKDAILSRSLCAITNLRRVVLSVAMPVIMLH